MSIGMDTRDAYEKRPRLHLARVVLDILDREIRPAIDACTLDLRRYILQCLHFISSSCWLSVLICVKRAARHLEPDVRRLHSNHLFS